MTNKYVKFSEPTYEYLRGFREYVITGETPRATYFQEVIRTLNDPHISTIPIVITEVNNEHP